MNDQTDQQLLRDYVERKSDPAFAAIVQRYVDLVYSAALRMSGDAHAAKDVTQGVFFALSRNASQLTAHRILAGWLYNTARNLAAKEIRSEVRRREREQQAVAMNELLAIQPDTNWDDIAPHLDAALGELNEPDREALLLRYFKNHDLRTVGAALGISDDAAQKRVSRAVERLREFFAKRGVAIGASGLVVVISANAVQAAPAGLAVTISTAAALTATAISTSTAIAATKTIAMTTLQKTLIGAALAAAIGTGIYEARQAWRLREQVQALQRQQLALTEQTQQLRNEREEASRRLTALLQENERFRGETAELPKLRGEVARLRPLQKDVVSLQKMATQSTSGLAEWKLDQVMNVGRTTPQDVVQSSLWAEMTTNLSEIRRSLMADESDPPTEADIDEFVDDPNNHLHFSKDELKTGNIKVLSQKIISPDQVVLTVSRQFDESGKGIAVPLTLRNVNGQWKIVVFNVRDEAGKVTRRSVFGARPPSP